MDMVINDIQVYRVLKKIDEKRAYLDSKLVLLWAALVAIALFSNSLVLLLKTIPESPLFQPEKKKKSFFLSTCFYVYISAP